MIQQDTMEQIIRSQQEQIADLLKTNRSLVESNGKLLEQTDALQRKIQEGINESTSYRIRELRHLSNSTIKLLRIASFTFIISESILSTTIS